MIIPMGYARYLGHHERPNLQIMGVEEVQI
jgi:hypothetical protein